MSSGGSGVLFSSNKDETMRKWHLRKELMVKGQEVSELLNDLLLLLMGKVCCC